jgi:hypothetical protein
MFRKCPEACGQQCISRKRLSQFEKKAVARRSVITIGAEFTRDKQSSCTPDKAHSRQSEVAAVEPDCALHFLFKGEPHIRVRHWGDDLHRVFGRLRYPPKAWLPRYARASWPRPASFLESGLYSDVIEDGAAKAQLM